MPTTCFGQRLAILREVHYKHILQKLLNQCTNEKHEVLILHGLKYVLKYKHKYKPLIFKFRIVHLYIVLISFDRASWIMKRRINNRLDADNLRFIVVISSTYFGHHYAHRQEYRNEPTDHLWCTTLVVLYVHHVLVHLLGAPNKCTRTCLFSASLIQHNQCCIS
jgi:hypothetical protein